MVRLLACSMLLFSAGLGYGQKYSVNTHNVVNLCGRKFTYSKSTVDTIDMENAKGELVPRIIKTEGWPIKMDDKVIHDERPKFNVSVEEHLYNRMKAELSRLPDGYFSLGIYNIIVDDKGLTCAFSYEGVNGRSTEEETGSKPVKVDEALKKIIFDKACTELAKFPAFEPPVIDGKKVVTASNPIYPQVFKVDKHKIFIKKNDSWKEIKGLPPGIR